MRYMHNFQMGRGPLTDDADILPYGWVWRNLGDFAQGLPFSMTLIAILLAHEFGHYLACKAFRVRSTLPLMLPAPSLSGTFGAIIRLHSRVPSRSALIVIAAMGPIAGFVVATGAVVVGLRHSVYLAAPVLHRIQPPMLLAAAHGLLHASQPLAFILPHPILTAAWMGLLITALNLIPAGQLDGGHIAYALSPGLHRVLSRVSVAVLVLAGVFFWVGWILWGLVLLMAGMTHPKVSRELPLRRWQKALAPVCVAILLLAATYQPFTGYDLLTILPKLAHRYHWAKH